MPQLKGPHIKLAGIELGIYYTIYILYTLQIGTVQTSMYYVVCTLLTIQAPNWACTLYTIQAVMSYVQRLQRDANLNRCKIQPPIFFVALKH